MIIHHEIQQNTPEWLALRLNHFTASEVGKFLVAEPKVTLTKDEIGAILDKRGIVFKKSWKHEELAALLTDRERYLGYTKEVEDARLTLICKKLGALNGEEMPNFLERNFAVQRGNELEPVAREAYAAYTGWEVVEVGFCTHDTIEGIGCSPDGLIPDGNGGWSHGLEIKAHLPERHVKDLLAGVVPDDHIMQIHASMAVTGINRWDYWAFCPNLPPLYRVIHRGEFTERVLDGLVALRNQFLETKAKMAELWNAQMNNSHQEEVKSA